MNLAEQNSADLAAWETLAPLLDEAMQKLNPHEQDVLLLRFFEGKSLRETGLALGTSEAAAQMRVNRALEKMRIHFARGGVTVATAVLATVLSAKTSHAAPVGLAARVTGPAISSAGGASMGAILPRIIFMTTKTKITTVFILSVIIIALVWLGRPQPQAQPVVPRAPAEVAPNPAKVLSTKANIIAAPVAPPAPVHAGEPLTSGPEVPLAVVMRSPTLAQVQEAKKMVSSAFDTPLMTFKLQTGKYPVSMEDLINKPPGVAGWNGPYVKDEAVPLDPWGNPYQYEYPATHQAPSHYDIWSMGPDGISGTDDDIGNWQN